MNEETANQESKQKVAQRSHMSLRELEKAAHLRNGFDSNQISRLSYNLSIPLE